jgi:hypothetical protein
MVPPFTLVPVDVYARWKDWPNRKNRLSGVAA